MAHVEEAVFAALSAFSAGTAAAFGATAFALARGERWRHVRMLGWACLAAAVFAGGDLAAWIGVGERYAALWAGNLNLAMAAIMVACLELYSATQFPELATTRRRSKPVVAILAVCALLSLVPGLLWTESLRVVHITGGIMQRWPVATPVGEVVAAVVALAGSSIYLRYAAAAKRELPWARAHAVGGAVMLALSVWEIAALTELVSGPTLLHLGFSFGLMPVLLANCVRLVGAEQTFALESQRLNAEVERQAAALVEARDQLLRAERLTALGTLATSVGHEINNPLTAIVVNLEYFADELARRADDKDLAEINQETLEAARRIERIVADMRIFARGAPRVEATPLAIGPVLDAALRLADHAVRHRARVVRHDEPDLPLVACDATRLAQVVVNLVINAALATTDAGRGPDDGTIEVSSRRGEDGSVEVVVRDQGVGMSEDTQRRIFEPFFSTRSQGQGTGLGLYVSLGIVKSFGGSLSVESSMGQGTTVRVSLPAATIAAAAPRAQAVPRTGNVDGLDVLVVEDDPQLAQSLVRMLGGAKVELASNGAAAVAALRERHFDVVLCDLMLPVVSGMEVFADAVARDAKLASRFLFMTGGPITEAARTFAERHDERLLAKPFGRAALLERIDGVIRTGDSLSVPATG